jgi:hypothetical protein
MGLCALVRHRPEAVRDNVYGVPEDQIVETLTEEAMRIAEEAGEAGETVPAGSPVVTVS